MSTKKYKERNIIYQRNIKKEIFEKVDIELYQPILANQRSEFTNAIL
jgi:hypothetical protein